MLTILSKEHNARPADCILDVEKEFNLYRVQINEITMALLKEIDGAVFISELKVRDSFGEIYDIERISSGCKAAFLASYSGRPVDMVEAGMNAITAAIKYIRTGTMYMLCYGVTVEGLADKAVFIDGKYMDTKAFKRYCYVGVL